MQKITRVLLIVLLVLVAIIVVGCAGGYWFITKSHPHINGTLRVPGLQAQVEIVRDAMGVPHIYAYNADDLFFAQGYVHAQDRLWQMDYNRRIGHATLSEVLGSAAIEYDRFLRTIGLARAARADYAALSAEDRRPLEAYARGVNAFIESHRDNLPIEFTLLGYTPAPWEPVDTIVWGKVMGYQLSGQYEGDLFRHIAGEKLGEAKLKEILPPYPAEGPFVIPPEAREYKSASANDDWQMANVHLGNVDWGALERVNALLAMHDPGIGSNNWVISGKKTTTGKPILANDPHLGIQMPSIWYANGLHCIVKTNDCPYNVVGFSFPAAPGVVIGHNDRIAWGVTTPYADVADLYIEKINPQNPNQYEYQGKWLDFEIVEEPIKVKGVVSETLKIKISRHGPIITPLLPGVKEQIAFQWTGLRERSRLFAAVLQINRAQNWDEFRAALKLWDAPSQNFVYADVDGNIGYQLPGNIPIRAKGNGMFPMPGTGEYEWTGYIPFDELPSVFNPPTNFVASANNCIVPSTYKYWLQYDCAAPFRQQRIFDLIKAKDKLSIEDVEAMHRDAYSIPEARLKTYLAALTPNGLLQARALEYVKSWDGYLAMDSAGATIVAATLQRAVRNIFNDQLDADLAKTYLKYSDYHQRVLLALLEQPNNEWWDDVTTKEKKETRDDILQKSFAEAIEILSKSYGDSPAEWKWGRLHTATFAHTLGSVQPLNLLFNVGPIPAPAGEATVMRMGFRAGIPFPITSVSSMRMIVDLGNLANSRYIHTTGQSGQPLHKHYSDMVLLWRDGSYVPMPFDRATIDARREGLLVLVP